MTLTELLAQLEANNAKSSGFLTADQLRGLGAAASVDLARPPGSITLLYSGESGVTLPDPVTGQPTSVNNAEIAKVIGDSSGGMGIWGYLGSDSNCYARMIGTPGTVTNLTDGATCDTTVAIYKADGWCSASGTQVIRLVGAGNL